MFAKCYDYALRNMKKASRHIDKNGDILYTDIRIGNLYLVTEIISGKKGTLEKNYGLCQTM